MSVVSKLQFTQASRSSHSWLSKQLQLVQSSKLVVAGLSFPELGTAQPQLAFYFMLLYCIEGVFRSCMFLCGPVHFIPSCLFLFYCTVQCDLVLSCLVLFVSSRAKRSYFLALYLFAVSGKP